ncbi:hypothetical protein AAMO2058_001680900 [Amorphochlora amoebiformis]
MFCRVRGWIFLRVFLFGCQVTLVALYFYGILGPFTSMFPTLLNGIQMTAQAFVNIYSKHFYTEGSGRRAALEKYWKGTLTQSLPGISLVWGPALILQSIMLPFSIRSNGKEIPFTVTFLFLELAAIGHCAVVLHRTNTLQPCPTRSRSRSRSARMEQRGSVRVAAIVSGLLVLFAITLVFLGLEFDCVWHVGPIYIFLPMIFGAFVGSISMIYVIAKNTPRNRRVRTRTSTNSSYAKSAMRIRTPTAQGGRSPQGSRSPIRRSRRRPRPASTDLGTHFQLSTEFGMNASTLREGSQIV